MNQQWLKRMQSRGKEGRQESGKREYDHDKVRKLRRPLSFLECMEKQATRLAAGVEAAVHAQAVQLLAAAAVDLQHLVERRDVPDVDEGHLAKLGAPLHGDADAVEDREQPVGKLLAQVEAHVGALPHAVQGVRALGLGEHILETDLKVVVDVVGIAVDEVELSHFGGLSRFTVQHK